MHQGNHKKLLHHFGDVIFLKQKKICCDDSVEVGLQADASCDHVVMTSIDFGGGHGGGGMNVFISELFLFLVFSFCFCRGSRQKL